MYAVRNTVTITDARVARSDLEQVVPQTSSLPGFVAGYWMASSEQQGVGLIVFDSDQAANNYADVLRSMTDAPGITVDQGSVEVWEVLARS